MGELPPIETNCHVTIDIPMKTRVPTQVREGKTRIYDPVLVSLGPFHRRDSRFRQVEDLKDDIVAELFSGGGEQKLLEEVRSRIGEVRSFYGVKAGDSGVDNEDLARMMLRDASFVVYCMRKMADHDGGDCIVLRRLGVSRLAYVLRDFFMLENQLPFFVLKKAASLTRGGGGGGEESTDEFFYSKLVSILNCCDPGGRDPPRENIPKFDKTLHLLDACRTTLVHEGTSTTPQSAAANPAAKSQFRSVTDLKAKGIHFRPTKSNSYCLRDIEFRSHSFYGMLRLPILLLDNKSSVILSNIIAMEMAPPGSSTDFAVTSYAKFMKSLVMKAEDVKELREKGILVSCLANDEEVVRLFQELNTEGSCRKDIFGGVREKINEHCRSKTKTFKAELLHTYFRSPWTAIALLAAILILCVNCLNFLLNYFKFRHPDANGGRG